MTASVLERVQANGVDFISPTGCQEYRGYCNDGGYAQVRVGGRSGPLVRVARLLLAQKLSRDLMPGEVARHTCDNPPCINPDHLIPGTQADNLADARARGRDKSCHTECVNGHQYPTDRPPSSTHNRCRECARDRNRRYHQRKAQRP